MTRLEAYRQAWIMKKMGMIVAIVKKDAEYDVAYKHIKYIGYGE